MKGLVTSTAQLQFGGGTAQYFCNISIPINGQFEIQDTAGGCLAINTAQRDVTADPASACDLNNGAGYAWDRWTAISIEYHSNQLWMLKSADNDECIYATVEESPITWGTCVTTDHAEWYSWPDSGLQISCRGAVTSCPCAPARGRRAAP